MTTAQSGTISTRIPARLDRLPWSAFHWRIVVGLGTVWILDGLEVTMVGSVAARLTEPGSGIAMTPATIGVSAAIYVAGACLGALFFGQLTDRFGRKKLFILTLALYIAATVATAFAFTPWYFYLARFFTGAGIGGDYAAINSAIDELIPARARGRVDLVINGTYWLGAAGGSALALVFLDESLFSTDVGWRLGFGFGAVLGFAILLVRRHVPESPRWLFIHGREDEAERIVAGVEQQVVEESGTTLDDVDKSITVRQRRSIPFRTIGTTAFKLYPRRAVLGLALFVGQAFIYNAFTFNLGGFLDTFFNVASGTVPLFLVVWALANFAGPVLLGRLFDTVGRKPMVAGCYLASAAITVPLIWLFLGGGLSDWGVLGFLVAIFFFASAGASAAYLTVSEIFPMETRALAIAFFYAVGTAIGGVTGPLIFGRMIASGDRGFMAVGLAIGAVAMAIGGVTEIFLGVRAERANLEDIAKPLTAQEVEAESPPAPAPDGGPTEHEMDAQSRREETERARARAADHRAAAEEERLAADSGYGTARERSHVEDTLAEAAELRAQALEQYAIAAEVLDSSDGTVDGSSDKRARAGAARQRAEALEEREKALTASSDEEARQHAELAEAAGERAMASEQDALVQRLTAEASRESGAAADLAAARASMHQEWSRMREARARMNAARSTNDQRTASTEEQHAGMAEQRALAAEQRVIAAEHLSAAESIRDERERTEAGQAERAEKAERIRRAEELEQRVRARVTARERRNRSGLRRFLPGPGARLHAGRAGGIEPRSVSAAEEAFDHEIGMIARALGEHGPTDRADLAQLVGARYWCPGRFGAALRAAVDEGRARQLSRRTYAPPEPNGS